MLDIADSSVFATQFLESLFREPGYDHLIRLAEHLEKKAHDENDRIIRADMKNALSAMSVVEQS